MILRKDEKQALLEGIRKLSDIFWGPSPQNCVEMLSDSFWTPFEKTVSFLDPPSAGAIEKIKIMIKTFSGAEALFDHLEETYVRLFISDRQGLRALLYASCYTGEESDQTTPLMGEPALAIKQRYLSKGLTLAEDIGEPPDHLSIELEYLYFLLEKGWAEKDDRLLEEASSFSSEVMLPWVLNFKHRLAAMDTGNPFYPLTATLLCGILQLIGDYYRTTKIR